MERHIQKEKGKVQGKLQLEFFRVISVVRLEIKRFQLTLWKCLLLKSVCCMADFGPGGYNSVILS